MRSGATSFATKKSNKEEIKDGFKRKRTGNVTTDSTSKVGRKLNNPKDKDTKENYENCQICGKSFKKGRGLNIHMSVTSCRATLERRIRNCKSKEGGTQEKHHSGTTRKNTYPTDKSTAEKPESQEETCMQTYDAEPKPKEIEVRKDNVLVIDDDIERAIKKEVLTLPQCVEKKIRSIRSGKEGRPDEYTGNMVILYDRERKGKKEKKKKERTSKRPETKSMDMRQFMKEKDEPQKKVKSCIVVRNSQPQSVKGGEEGASTENDSNTDTREVVVLADNNDDERKVVLETMEHKREVILQSDSNRCNEMNNDMKLVTENINTGYQNEILSSNYLQLCRRDYRSLTGINFLNDKVIDEYLHLIQERSKEENLPTICALPVHLYTGLDLNYTLNAEKYSGWIKEDLEKVDIILIPVNKTDHWSLLAMEVKKMELTLHDSIMGSRKTSNAPRIIKKFLQDHWARKGKEVKIRTKIEEKAALQGNGYDCGVFLLENAEMLSRRALGKPKQENMAEARKRIMKEIFVGKLIEERNPSIFKLVREKAAKASTIASFKMPKDKKPQKKRTKEKIDKSAKPERKAGGRKERINWPKSNSLEWERLDDDMSALLKVLIAPAEIRAKTHPNVIYGMCRERFGIKEQKHTKETKAGPSRRQKKCSSLREEINSLKRAVATAPSGEKEAIKELQAEKLKKLRLAKRAEALKQSRKKFASNCKSFLTQPYQFARDLLSPKPKGELKSSKEEVEEFLAKAHSDDNKETAKESCDGLLEFGNATKDFDDRIPAYNEFLKKLRQTRSKSAPGPNGVPYLVYKRCPKVAKLLWGYLRELWRKNIISEAWREAEGIFIPKEDDAKAVEKFRTISLLNVEGKLFFALKADRITDFVTKNNFINTSIQKGGIPKVSGCLEHTAILSQLIKEAKAKKRNLVVTWLDIANAYGSMPHRVIKDALEAAKVPEKVRELISSYYSNVKIRFTTKTYTTNWQQLEKGIITGCTLSVILFALSMSWLVDSVKDEAKGPVTSSGQRQANSRLFMDDIATTTEIVPQTNRLLEKLSEKFKWADLKVRADKCRSLVIYKGKVIRRRLKIDGEVITPIQDKPVRYLGKEYKATLTEKEQILETEKMLKTELKKIDKCKIPGRYKGWILQYMLIPRLMWPLTIYSIPETKIEEFQKTMTGKIKKWMGFPRNLSVNSMYAKTSRLRLPFSSLTEEFRVTKARNMVTFQESTDPCIRGAEIEVDAGRKANTKEEVREAKLRLKQQEIIGITNKGREGLGMRKSEHFSQSSNKTRRDLIVRTIREKEEEKRTIKMTELSNQGAQMRWEVPQRRLKQVDLMRMSEERIKFIVKAVYDLLPTPANKKKWFDSTERCLLCNAENPTLNHILVGCKVALSQGRYKWRHDQVLKILASSIETKLHQKEEGLGRRWIQFVKAGEKQDGRKGPVESYLSSAKDWKLSVDLKQRVKIPNEICCTDLRPDIIIVSKGTKQMAITELTVPSEERIEVAGELKKQKYEKIATEGKQNGWRVRCWAVEVGCRGFPATSMSCFLRDIGYSGKERKELIEKISKRAEEASRSIWKASHYKQWGHSGQDRSGN